MPLMFGLVRRAIAIDQTQFFAEKHEKADKNAPRPNQSQPSRDSSRKSNAFSNSYAPHRPPAPPNSFSPYSSGFPPRSPGPRPSPHSPLTDAEKDHREKNGLCRVCGSPNHWKTNCPRYLAKVEREKQQPPLRPRYPTPVSTSSVPSATSAQIILPPVTAPALRRLENSTPQDPSQQDA